MDAIALAIDRLLASPWAEARVAPFADVVYDADKRAALVQAIREQVATQLADLPEEARAQAADGVVSAIARRARLLAPARKPRPEAKPLLAGRHLENHIILHYPAPIAIPYRAMTDEREEAGKFGCLLDTFEAAIHFLATVAVSAYLRTDLSNAACNKFLLPQLMRGKWAVGHVMGLLREVIRHAGDCGGHLPYPELPGHLFRPNGKPTDALDELDSFVELRNHEWGHRTGRTGEYYGGLYQRVRPELDGALARMDWLAGWHVIRPVKTTGEHEVILADLFEGERRSQNCDDICPRLRPEDLHTQDGDVRIDSDALLLVSPDRARYLPLFPLAVFPPHRREAVAFFLQNPQWKRQAHLLRLVRAEYVAYKGNCENHVEERDYSAVCLEKHVGRLRDRQPDALPALAEASATADPDYTIVKVANEQRSHLRHFVGREPFLQEIADWIDGKAGGYLLLLGPPGQGKSALMAELARREGERGGCLLHMVKSERSPLKFLPSLTSQAAKLAHTRLGSEAYQGDVDQLRAGLVKGVEALRGARGRAVVVIDALDELPDDANVNFLPPQPPEGVRVVLSCRPNVPLVNSLKNRLHGQHEIREVPDLAEADFRELLGRRLEAGELEHIGRAVDYADVFRHLGGHPLFLHHFIDRVRQESEEAAKTGQPFHFDVAALPTTNQEYCRDVCNRVRQLGPGGFVPLEGRIQSRLLQLLCVARDGLRVQDLADLLAADGQPVLLNECNDRMEAISQYLLDIGNGRYRPFHQALADFVRRDDLGAAGLRQVEEVFRRWLDQPEQSHNLYAQRHGIDHRLAAGDLEGAVRKLSDWRYLEAKTEAGLVFGLGNDFRAVLEKLPKDHPWRRRLVLLAEALQREVHFLDRRPTCLFQHMWNLAWWYDHPNADPYFEGGSSGPEPPAPKLHEFLDDWRREKEMAQTGFVWLRALWPPGTPLGTGLRAILRGHLAPVPAVVWSPDGTTLASGSNDQTIRIWDATTGAERLCFRGHAGPVKNVCWSPDGSALVSGSDDGTVRVWDAATGIERRCLTGHEGPVRSVAWSPEGSLLASGGNDCTVRVWDAATGAERHCLRRHEKLVLSVSWAPRGEALASGSYDCTLRVWDPATGTERHCLLGRGGPVQSLCWSPDGSAIACGGDYGTLRVWDLATGTARLSFQGHTKSATCVRWAADGSSLASSSNDGTIRVWDAASGAEKLCLRGHDGPVWGVCWSPEGAFLASASKDATIRLWDLTGTAGRIRRRGHGDRVLSVSWAPGGTALASASADKTARTWDVASGAERLCFRKHGKSVQRVSWSPGGAAVLSWSNDGTVRLWDAATGAERLSLWSPDQRFWCHSWSPDGATFAGAFPDHSLRVWDAVTGAERLVFWGHSGRVYDLAWSADGSALASASEDRTVRVWDLATRAERHRFRGGKDYFTFKGVAWSPDGALILALCSDTTVWVWDAKTGERRSLNQPHSSLSSALRELAGNASPGLSLSTTSLESAVNNPPGQAIGWVSPPVAYGEMHGRQVAGAVGSDLVVYALEGRLSPQP